MTILIVGAGIVGFVLALSCHLVGVPFRVYEKTKKNEPLGVKIYIQPYAVCDLIELGLRDELEELSVRTTNVVYFSKLGGENWAEPRGTDTGYRWPQYSIHREKLQTMLHQALKARTHENVLETGCSLTEFQQTIGDINAKFRSRQGTSTFDVTREMPIACDNIYQIISQ